MSDQTTETSDDRRGVLSLGLLSVLVCTAVFGPVWLPGFVVYVALVIGMFWQIKRRKATERADQ